MRSPDRNSTLLAAVVSRPTRRAPTRLPNDDFTVDGTLFGLGAGWHVRESSGPGLEVTAFSDHVTRIVEKIASQGQVE